MRTRLARNLNHLLKINGKSQIEVAKDLGINQSTFSTWCTGSKMPRLDKVKILAKYFNVSDIEMLELEPHFEEELSEPVKNLLAVCKTLSDKDASLAVDLICTILNHRT